jgi:predicted nucleic acid-binding protein
MIVIDASAVVELLLHRPMAEALGDALAEANDGIVVPHLVDVEAVSAVRQLAAAGLVDAHGAAEFLEALGGFQAERVPHAELLQRAWELRHNFTAYDAVYIALAEANGATLLTCDAKLLKGHRAKVRLFRVQ